MKLSPSPSGPAPNRPPSPVSLISGSRGLAETLLATFEKAGHRLSVLVRKAEALPRLRELYPKGLFYVGDLGSRENCAGWIEATLERFGRIDCLINNAAVQGPGGRLHEVDFEEFEQTIQMDLLGPLFLCQQAIPHLIRAERGVVINLAGGGATAARPYFSAYAAAKCALVRVTENLALEYPELCFYAISPGTLNTQMMQEMIAMGPERIGKEYAAARRCADGSGEDPAKAANLALWLCENRPARLSGRLISAIWDDYEHAPDYPPEAGWWTLRRVDEVCRKHLLQKP